MKSIKQTISLLSTLLFLSVFSCENTSTDLNSNETNTALSNSEIVELSESFDQDEESLTEDLDDTFSAFEENFSMMRGKNGGDKPKLTHAEYDSNTGYWTRKFEGTRNRTDSVVRDDKLIVRNLAVTINKTSNVRFTDENGNWMEHPKKDRNLVTKIELERAGTFASEGEVYVYFGDSVDVTKQRSSHKDISNTSVLSRLENDLWALTANGQKEMEFEITKNGETKTVAKNVTVSMSDVVVKKAHRKIFGRKMGARIVSGTILRTVVVNEHTIEISTTYYDCDTDEQGRRFTRTIKKDGELIKESVVYCSNTDHD